MKQKYQCEFMRPRHNDQDTMTKSATMSVSTKKTVLKHKSPLKKVSFLRQMAYFSSQARNLQSESAIVIAVSKETPKD